MCAGETARAPSRLQQDLPLPRGWRTKQPPNSPGERVASSVGGNKHQSNVSRKTNGLTSSRKGSPGESRLLKLKGAQQRTSPHARGEAKGPTQHRAPRTATLLFIAAGGPGPGCEEQLREAGASGRHGRPPADAGHAASPLGGHSPKGASLTGNRSRLPGGRTRPEGQLRKAVPGGKLALTEPLCATRQPGLCENVPGSKEGNRTPRASITRLPRAVT